MYDLLYIINILTKKYNILCEYAMVKQAMKKYVKLFDFSNAFYVQISRKEFFLFKKNVQRSVNFLKSGFYYSILVDTKFQNPLYESKWKNIFYLNSDFNWETVSPLCDVCLVDEDIKHLLFECDIDKNIWQKNRKI